MWKIVKLIIFIVYACTSLCSGAKQFTLNFSHSTNKVIVTDNYYALEYSIYRDGVRQQTVSLGTGLGGSIRQRLTSRGFILYGRGDEIEFTIEDDQSRYSQFSISRKNIAKSVSDCIDLGMQDSVNWFGGNQRIWQYYPIQLMTHNNNAYITKEETNQAITERYWLNSRGIFFYADLDFPLFIDQNNEHPGFLCLRASRAPPYFTSYTRFDFSYHVGIELNARDAHMKGVEKFLGKPTSYPDENMVREPIWSTWARYKAPIDEAILRQFASEILTNGFSGQFEIDDDWEVCYGAMEFSTTKFPNIKNLTDDLHSMGFARITLWIHPFINKNCTNYYEAARNLGYLVADRSGNSDTQWWNSQALQAAYIDFTKYDAANWFYDNLKALQTSAGIDSYKFDAGETSWSWISQTGPVLNTTLRHNPSQITIDYVRTVAKLGSLIEVRSGQNTQDLGIFVRMLDKDTEWTLRNGLPTLITTLLQMNMVGYPFVLPDMIGGNGYNNVRPDKEIFIRWLQANVFMPSLQFSFVPWDYDSETVTISKKFVALHAQYTPEIIERFQLAVANGSPVNPPIWWIAVNDKIAQTVSDQFLLGEKILVAPVIVEGARTRDIYLPAGKWIDPNNDNRVYDLTEGQWLRDYSAPLDVLPYFIKN